ncbi:MAG: hypothetical protein JRJ12_05910 [Deltaproteobacteria bacterium]|nr:hypothetical protein [Deltaproteobacteria bacterium]MBW2070647.1 hypothetical protein [Deltaproteobacteria bacterium]
MARIKAFELYAVDLPFRRSFRHAAAVRRTSESIFLKCLTDDGHVGFGESLPRAYVTGETRKGAFSLLQEDILPRLLGMEFHSLAQVLSFLHECDGKAPSQWASHHRPQNAAWAAVDLALLDAFGRAFGRAVRINTAAALEANVRFSAVLSAQSPLRALLQLARIRLYGLRQLKLKVGQNLDRRIVRTARQVLGASARIIVDANMAWNFQQTLEAMAFLARKGIRCVEQPTRADDVETLANLVARTDFEIIADESIHDRKSLRMLIARNGCTGVNVRISKCGGLIASYNRCREALQAGLDVHLGCQVGESSLLSAAQLILLSALKQVKYCEGCFGLHLLQCDPVRPLVQFGYAGCPPELPQDDGLGIQLNPEALAPWCSQSARIGHS